MSRLNLDSAVAIPVPFAACEKMIADEAIETHNSQASLLTRTQATRRDADGYHSHAALVTHGRPSAQQRQYGFDVWNHQCVVQRVSDTNSVVTDSMAWRNGSVASRRLDLVGNTEGGTNLVFGDWQISVQGVPRLFRGIAAGKMSQDLSASDGEVAGILTGLYAKQGEGAPTLGAAVGTGRADVAPAA